VRLFQQELRSFLLRGEQMISLKTHWMIIAEEEHLRAKFGEEYERYCEQAPRYLLNIRKFRRASP
jgi:hypothetical protein